MPRGRPKKIKEEIITPTSQEPKYQCGNAACGKTFFVKLGELIKCPVCGWTYNE